MEKKELTIEQIGAFRFPRYNQLPDGWLYLEQVAKYINGYISSLGVTDITTSMISNYVKKGIIGSPVKKHYGADQIAELFFVAVAKNVLSIDYIGRMFAMMRDVYTYPVAYDYFCTEFENILHYTFGICGEPEPSGVTVSPIKDMLDEVIVATVNTIHIDYCFRKMDKENG